MANAATRLRAAVAIVTSPIVGLYRAIHPDTDGEALLLLALVGLGIGCALVYPPAGLIVPCSILTAAVLGSSFRRGA